MITIQCANSTVDLSSIIFGEIPNYVIHREGWGEGYSNDHSLFRNLGLLELSLPFCLINRALCGLL